MELGSGKKINDINNILNDVRNKLSDHGPVIESKECQQLILNKAIKPTSE